MNRANADFWIKQTVYVDTIEAYRKMEQILEQEKQNQITNAVGMR